MTKALLILCLVLYLNIQMGSSFSEAKSSDQNNKSQNSSLGSVKNNNQCEPVEGTTFRLDEKGKSFEHIPVRDQKDLGGLGNCYAVTASEMADAWRFKYGGVKTPFGTDGTSDLYAALKGTSVSYLGPKVKCPERLQDMLAMKNSERFIEGGNACDAIKMINQEGSCSQVKVINWLKSQNTAKLAKEELVHLASAAKHFDELYKVENVKAYCLSKYLNEKKACSIDDYRIKQVGKELLSVVRDWKNIEKNVELLPLMNSFSELELEMKKATKILEEGPCRSDQKLNYEDQKIFPRFSCIGIDRAAPSNAEFTDAYLKEIIIGSLKTHELPIAASFCTNFMVSENNSKYFTKDRWIYPASEMFYERRSEDCAGHVAPIIGSRKCKNGHTQLLIHNSWGTKRPKELRNEIDWDNGKQWIDSDLLLKNTMGLEFIVEMDPKTYIPLRKPDIKPMPDNLFIDDKPVLSNPNPN